MNQLIASARRKATALGTLAALTAAACAPMGMAGGPVAGGMTDGEIVAVAMASNQGEVVTSQPALTNAAAPAVRQFAQQMITDHTAALQQLEALGIPPVPNELSQQLTQTAQATAQTLQNLRGPAFDRTYMQAQVNLHQYTLNTLDTYLIPSARNGALRQGLQAQRAIVQNHLERARSILGTLQ